SSAMAAKIFPNCLPYCFRPIRFSAGNSGSFFSRRLRELRRWAHKMLFRCAHLRNSRNLRLKNSLNYRAIRFAANIDLELTEAKPFIATEEFSVIYSPVKSMLRARLLSFKFLVPAGLVVAAVVLEI